MLFLRKPMTDFSILKCACFWCHVPYGSIFGRPSSLSFFLNGRNPTLLVRKFFTATTFFIAPCSGSPRYCSFALWEVTLGFLLFLAGSPVPEKDVSALCFLCFFGCFPLNCLNLVLAVLYASGIPIQLFYAGSSSIFWSRLFSFFFLYRLWGSSFYGFWASSLLGLPPLFLISFFMAPCFIPLGLGAVIF